MIIHKLRIDKGWSQQQLADMSGLSKRTIQRIESGNTPSVESVKSLAAVFEVDFSTLQRALAMNKTTVTDNNTPSDLALTQREMTAYKKVRQIKKFYIQLCAFFIVVALLAIINWWTSPDYWWVKWVILGWGMGLILRGLKTFDIIPPLGVEWEKRQLKKYLD